MPHRRAYLSAGETQTAARGLRTTPGNLWLRRRFRSSPFRASFLPVHLLGSQCPSSHMASGHGISASGPHSSAPRSPSTQAENSRHALVGSTSLLSGSAERFPHLSARPPFPQRRCRGCEGRAAGLRHRRTAARACRASERRASPRRASWPRARAERPRWPRRALPLPAEVVMAAARLLLAVSAGAALGERVSAAGLSLRSSARPLIVLCLAGLLASAGKMKIVEEPNTFG